MTKPALLKLLVVIMIMFILILPEYFKTSKGNIVELSCLDVNLLNNFTYPLPEFNISFVSFLHQEREHEVIVLGISAKHFHFHNMSKVCPLTSRELQLYSSCLVCESKGTKDFIHQELTTKASIMNDSMEMKAENFLPLRVIFNFTVVPVVDDLGGYDTTCVVKLHLTNFTAGKEPMKTTLLNSSHRSMQSLNNCNQVSLQLEMETGNSTCTMRITWYVLVLLVFIFLIIFIAHKIFQENRRVRTWQNHRYKPASTLLKGNDSEKLRRVLNIHVISGATKQRGPSTFTGAKEALPPISELEHFFHSESERSIYTES
ncbi:transmembrane protein 156 isoform X1 [Phascolarctos cinereus]|uniref:Transmembrane protein 156 isoform X1 n=2 Tax=Phascolarctos cinereus TaxID=38626 RepID=A0A6P5KRF4_PHACI|nr:transmembrane protein 156 isoform X1 [Phascolarctos cinereus]